MSINLPSNRYPYQHPDPHTDQGFRLLMNANTDTQQAIVLINAKVAALTSQVTTATTTVTTTKASTPSTGGSFPVNVNEQTADYVLQQTDVAGLNYFTGTGPYALELNVGVVKPFYTSVLNLSSGIITATPTAASGRLVNNLASVTIAPTQWAIFYWDGVNWWALEMQVFPQTKTVTAHQFLVSYDATTGLFVAAQPTYQDIVYGFGATGSRPGTPTNGMMFFDSTLGIPIWWDSTQWIDATGTPV
jgi:hypothetical protein